MKYRYSTLFMLFFALLSCVFVKAEAGQIHALIMGDTNDDRLGTAFEQDIEYLKAEVNRVSYYTEMPLNLRILRGDEVRTKNIAQTIHSFNIKDDDVVIFYFACHGFRTPSKKTPWPNLSIGNEHKGIDFHAVNQIIKTKNPRFFLSIADCCNSIIPDGHVPMYSLQKELGFAFPSQIKKNYRSLFLDIQGSVIISASHPSQYAWAYTETGNIYTLCLLQSLKSETKKSEGTSWEAVLDKASLLTILEVDEIKVEDKQVPQFQINYW